MAVGDGAVTMEMPRADAEDLAWLSTDQMREVDRVMVEDLHIELLQVMENAGRNLARLAIDGFGVDEAVVFAGAGGNGGGGLVAARHLDIAGVDVSVVLDREATQFTPAARHQLDIAERMGIAIEAEPRSGPVALDCLIGYSLHGDPRGRTAELVGAVNRHETRIALDVPSGLDGDSGTPGDPCVTATATMTLALPKMGLRRAPQVGRLFLADISVPPTVYAGMGIDDGLSPDFAPGPLIEILGL